MTCLRLDSTLLDTLGTTVAQEEVYDSLFSGNGSFGVRLSAKGTKAFFLIYSLRGRRKRITLGRYPVISLEQAREKAYEILRLVASGRDPSAEGKHYLVSPSFEQLASRFLSEHVRKNLSKHTAKEYTRIIKRELVPCWGWRSAQSIEPSDVRALLTAIAKERGSVVMSERVSGLLSNIFSFGIRNGWLKENPAKNSVLPRLSSEPLRVMSKDELRQLWSLLLEEKSLSSCILRVMLLTGQRPGLVSSMRWEDIRFERWVIKRREKPDSLSRSIFPRSIFLSVEARETLKEALSLGGVQDFVFPSRDGGHIRHLRKSSARMSKKMSNSAPWSPLDIYRSIPKHLRVEGVRPHVVQALLGRGPALPGEDHDGYFEDIKAALQLWSDILTKPDKHPSGGRLGKLIPLFPEQKKS